MKQSISLRSLACCLHIFGHMLRQIANRILYTLITGAAPLKGGKAQISDSQCQMTATPYEAIRWDGYTHQPNKKH